MISKSSKWKLGFVHYNVKFTISRFVISSFECTDVYCNNAGMSFCPLAIQKYALGLKLISFEPEA